MSFEACAGIVERGDPDRFMAAMAAPPMARQILFPLYAFNVEVSRAPWVTEEPMIAEMRLQWWRDALEEIAEGRPVRSHEVTTPLAEILDPAGAQALDRLIAARRWDVYKDAFEDEGHLADYLEATGGELMWQAARAMGTPEDARNPVIQFGKATATARFLQAVPKLEAAGRVPLLDGRAEGVADVARQALPHARRPKLTQVQNAATLEGWQTAPILNQIAKTPLRVAAGAVGLSPFRSKIRLLMWS
ncbi:squalene/phytoene synthase family protein [Pseudooctadecabacter jejudonensis]|uniref:Squalene/phytoene synthase n=1 Tax=Pseudooctadecabacter jejudonensis TaxID=1391910 RepID=A0A1Y5RCT8_9RHOB|nr:squalene/phytoene synthase family protein [Pseudooctadecabacter jejudonensis]SLN14551.1 Squalene/phytoene synthase [Pseudooctadecabacter jejudonensis]